MILWRSGLVLALSVALAAAASESTPTRQMFDAFARFITQDPSARYNQTLFSGLTSCMAFASPLVYPASQDAAWQGFISYSVSNGTSNDTWGGCTWCPQYHEHRPTPLIYNASVPDITIYEPCNFVSNLAYYRIAPEICHAAPRLSISTPQAQALVQGFVALGWGSSFWHGSHTYLGNLYDNKLINVIAFIAHQAAVEDLSSSNTSVLHDLALSARSEDAVATTNAMTANFTKLPVTEWQSAIGQLDMPSYETTFSAIISTLLSLLLSETKASSLINSLAKAFKLPAKDKSFLLDYYLPTIRGALDNVRLGLFHKIALARAFIGTAIKLLYAFVWQERVFPNPFFLKPGVNKLGAALMPAVNSLANTISGFKHYDHEIQVSTNVYPGDTFCRVNQSHSKWHEESANGLLDLVYAADKMKGLIKASTAATPDQLPTSELARGLTFEELAEWGREAVADFGPEVSGLVRSAREVFMQLDVDHDGVVDWVDIEAHLEHSDADLLWENVKAVMASWF